MYAIVEDNQVIEYPVIDIRKKFPNVSFPDVITSNSLPDGVVEVADSVLPAYNQKTHKLQASAPKLVNGSVVVEYVAIPLSEDELEHQAKNTEVEIVNAVQDRLDNFAKTRNYDGILSACTYATSNVQKFSAEGQKAVDLRDATWSKLYQIMAEVQLGQRDVPTCYADIEDELPALGW